MASSESTSEASPSTDHTLRVQFQFIDEQERRTNKKSHLRTIVRANARKSHLLNKKLPAKQPKSLVPSPSTAAQESTANSANSQEPGKEQFSRKSQQWSTVERIHHETRSSSSSSTSADTSTGFSDDSSPPSSSDRSSPNYPVRPKAEKHQTTPLTAQAQKWDGIFQANQLSRRRRTDGRQFGHQRSSPLSILNKTNPFDCLPVRVDSHTNLLMDYYVDVCMDPNSWMKWMPLCSQNEMTFKSLLLCAETFHRGLRGLSPWSKRAVAWSLECVRLLRREMEQSKQPVSEVMIATVVHMAVIELFWGDDKHGRPHLKGLKEMAKLAGDMGDDESGNHLKATIIWLEYIGSRKKEPNRSSPTANSPRLCGDLLQDTVPLRDAKLVRSPADTGSFNATYKLECIRALSELQTLISKIPAQKLKDDYILTALSELI